MLQATTATCRQVVKQALRHAVQTGIRPAICALLTVAFVLPPAAYAQNTLPALGDGSGAEMSVGAERRLGEQIMREIRRDPDYVDDPIELEYLQSIWQPLLAAARQRGDIDPQVDAQYGWEPFLVRDRSVNAFALPGGFVGVHLGMIAITSTRDELASVIAHEMSHVTQRHIARMMVNSARQSLISMAAIILGALAATKVRGDAGSAILTGGQAAAMQGQLNFSRDMEREADRVGYGLLASGGFAPSGMADMFERLGHASNLNDNSSYPYLRSHPLTTERIGEARARLGSGAVKPVDISPLEHAAARGRARVLMDVRDDALRRWQALDKDRSANNDADKLSAAYESALASTMLRDWSRADASLATARNIAQGVSAAERAVALLAGQSLIERGDLAAAADRLQPYAGKGSRPVTLMLGQIALAPREVDKASLQRSADMLQTWVSSNPRDADAWSLLGRSWDRLAFPLRAIRADAEARVAVGDLPGAIDRLKAGQRIARGGASTDFIEASVIDARLRDIEQERKLQEQEKPLG
ncbi:M48 family metalloprotease [soil metagenome]